MCHALLHDPRFFTLLLQIDHELAAQTQAQGCICSGPLHQANYPRKPRGCPPAERRMSVRVARNLCPLATTASTAGTKIWDQRCSKLGAKLIATNTSSTKSFRQNPSKNARGCIFAP